MNHLTPDELIDALDGGLAAERRSHLDTCVVCHEEAASLRALMSEVRAVDIPETPPFFWDRLSTRIRQQVADDSAPRRARWFSWPVFAPVTAMALLIAALVLTVAGTTADPESAIATVALSEDPAQRDDVSLDLEAQWALLTELAGDVDPDRADAEGIVAPLGAADTAVLRLSAAEQQELARLLRLELKLGG